jgi:hypothetical protein
MTKEVTITTTHTTLPTSELLQLSDYEPSMIKVIAEACRKLAEGTGFILATVDELEQQALFDNTTAADALGVLFDHLSTLTQHTRGDQ